MARFSPVGLVAIAPAAFGVDYAICDPPKEPFSLLAGDRLAAVEVHGPLAYADWRFDCYRNIEARFDAALASKAQYVVMVLDSPGGEVAGAFDCARTLRAKAKRAGKPLIAFIGSQCQSAAYALATAADRIIASSSAVVGSIGIIATAIDVTRADAAMGVAYAVIGSGERKTDGNPHVAISDGQLEAMRRSVDAMARVFFDLVSEHRGVDAEPYEAASFVGAEALAKGLVDEIATFDDLLIRATDGSIDAMLQTKANAMLKANAKAESDDTKEDAVRAALVTASESDDPEKARRAKAALEAYDKAAKAEGEDEDEKKDEAKAETEEEKPAASAQASAGFDLVALAKTITKQVTASLEARRAAELDAQARAEFWASRPDLGQDFRDRVKALPLADIKAIAAAIPSPNTPPATAVPNPFVAEVRPTQPAAEHSLSPNPALDAAFGLNTTKLGVVNEGNVQTFGAPVPATGGN